jgi:hypothetical protein
MRIEPPDRREYAPAFERYVARVREVDDPLQELRAQRDRVLSRLSPLTAERAAFRYAPEKWSVKEMIGHLSDAERVFAYRLLRIGRGDTTPLPGFEENDYVRAARSDRRPFDELLSEWAVVRDASAALASSLPEADWTNAGTCNGAPVTTRALLYVILGHTEHHLAVLADRYSVR